MVRAPGPTQGQGSEASRVISWQKSRRDSRPRLLAKASAFVVAMLAANLCSLTACAQKSPEPPKSNVAGLITVQVASKSDEGNRFNEIRAMRYINEIVAFGPRPIGSANHKKVEDYILAHLKGDEVESDSFTADTPEGKFPVHNIIAKFPGNRDGIIVIASHYDTNYPLRNTSYIGANDGASSSALLLEIANQLRGKKRDGYSVWLVWDDAEESIKSDTELPFLSDSLYGIRHIADKWQSDGTLKKMKAFILTDMIGDADLNIERPQNSTAWLEDLIYQAASSLGYQSHFFARTGVVGDDHVPFLERGVPSADLIDFDYGYNNVFWHTTQDTVDKLSPQSLEIVGSVILKTVNLLDQR